MLDKMVMDIESTKNDFKMNTTVEFTSLNVLTGMNGSGKTLIMKFAWFAGYVLQAYKLMLVIDPENSDKLFAEMLQKVFRWTFDEPQDMIGTISIQDVNREKFDLTVAFKDGDMDYFDIDVIDPKEFSVGSIASVQFNSKEARTFTQYAKYLKIKKKFGITELTEENLDEICDIFKLYDVLWFENLQRTVDDLTTNGLNPIFTSVTGRSALNSIFAGADSAIEIDSDKTTLVEVKQEEGVPIFIMANGDEKRSTSLSSGQQSMLMMTIFGIGSHTSPEAQNA